MARTIYIPKFMAQKDHKRRGKNPKETIMTILNANDINQIENGDFAPEITTQKGLEKELGIHNSQISRHLKELINNGLVRAKKVNVKGTYMQINGYYLTKKGKKIINKHATTSHALYFEYTPPALIINTMQEINELQEKLFESNTEKEKQNKINIFYKLSRLYHQINQMPHAINYALQSYLLAEENKDKEALPYTLANLIEFLFQTGNYTQAHQYSQILLNIEPDAKSYYLHGMIARRLGNVKEAITFLQTAIETADPQDKELLYNIHNSFGALYSVVNKVKKARNHYQIALELAEGDTRKTCKILNNMGMLHYHNKQYEKAIPHFEQIITISKDKDHLAIGYANIGLAYCLAKLKKIKEANQANVIARNIFIIYADQGMLASTKRIEAVIETNKGNHETAILLFKEAIEHA